MPKSDLLSYLFPDSAYLAHQKKKKKKKKKNAEWEKKEITRF